MDAEADVALAAAGRLARVDPHAHAQLATFRPRVLGQPALTLQRRRRHPWQRRKATKNESPCVSISSVVLGEGLAQNPPVIGERCP